MCDAIVDNPKNERPIPVPILKVGSTPMHYSRGRHILPFFLKRVFSSNAAGSDFRTALALVDVSMFDCLNLASEFIVGTSR